MPAVDPGAQAQTWTIAAIAEEFGVTHRTVRHYEDLGLITPERRGTQRIYHRRDRTRLSLILRGKRLGFPLEEIRTIIDLYDAPGVGAASSSTSWRRSTTGAPTSNAAVATSTRP
jgi:transcriptional regulator, MerR family